MRTAPRLLVVSTLTLLTACFVPTTEGVVDGSCADGFDNDGNGTLDCDDPGCAAVAPCAAEGGTATEDSTGTATASDTGDQRTPNDDTDTGSETGTGTGSDTGTATSTATATDTGPMPQCVVDTELGSAEGDAVATGIAVGNEVQTQCGAWNLPDTVVSWTAPRDGTWHFDTVGSPSDTVIAAFDDGCFQTLDCSEDAFGDWSASRLDLFAGDTVNLAIETSDTAGWVLNVWEGACVDLNLGGELSAETSTVGEDTTLPVPSECFANPNAPNYGNDVVFRWVAPARGVWTFSTEGSSFDTVLSLRRGGCEADVELCSDNTADSATFHTYSMLQAWLDGGEHVLLAVGGYDGANGAVNLTIALR